MSPSEKIAARAIDIGVTQAEIRREMERRGVLVSAASVSLWMSGGRLPSGRRLEILCEVLAIYGKDARDLCAAVAVWEAPSGR
jgi:hypothetical protein